MSIIKYRELSLSEVVEESNLIIEVEFVEKYNEEISVSGKEGSDSEVKASPPFIKKGNVFNVIKVLKNTGLIKVPAQIRVPEENWRRSLSQYKEMHFNGVSKSYTVLDYATETKSVSKAAVLFLHHFQDMYELTARNAFEGKASLEKITILISAE